MASDRDSNWPNPDSTIALSLISHTNAGKTTLARTLLGRDVGEVRDAQHVTQEADAVSAGRHAGRRRAGPVGHARASATARASRAGSGSRAIRSAGSCRRSGTASAITRSFCRSRPCATCATRPTSCSISSTRRRRPRTPGYLAPELAVLEWIGKPVIVLLNQTGRPRPRDEERADEARWRDALGSAADHPRGDDARRVRALLGAGDRAVRPRRRCAAGSAPRAVRAARRRVAEAPPRAVRRSDDRRSPRRSRAGACDREARSRCGVVGALREIGRSLGLGSDDCGEREGARVAGDGACASTKRCARAPTG